MTPDEVVQTTAIPIGTIGATFYFQPETIDTGKQLGLSAMRFYVAGRGGVLGNPDAAVVASAFGYFNPALIAKLWDSALEVMDPKQIAERYIACAHETGRKLFSSIDPAALKRFVDMASDVIARPDNAGLALFAGLRAQPVPTDDPAAAAMHQAMVLRELRGCLHLVAVVAAGIRSEVAHAIRRPDDVEMFGWREPIEVSDDVRERWQWAEELTSTLLAPHYQGLDAESADDFAATVAAMHDACTAPV